MHERFIKIPNLPQNKVKSVIIGDIYRDLLEKPLVEMGIKVYTVPSTNLLQYQVRAHADMLVAYIGNGEFVCMEEVVNEISAQFTVGPIIYHGKNKINPKYPNDIAFNVLQIGGKCFHNTPYTDIVLREKLESKGVEFVKVRQGYTKCSVCVVDENSAITSDRNIYNALISNGIDTLLISEGYIDLDGYDYGFIGGSCGKISKNEIAFTGRFNKHPDCDRILEFLNARKIDAKFLTDKDIFDIGSILPITEECEEIV